QNVAGMFHPVGTCRMGAAGDRDAVVDPTGRGRGVGGLRVVDASIMPTLPPGDTNIPTIMVAEKSDQGILDEARAAGLYGRNEGRQAVSDWERESRSSEVHATRATARLPGLNIEVVHRQSPAGDAEEMSIHLQAVPSFEAFGRFLEEANPFAFWLEASRLAW